MKNNNQFFWNIFCISKEFAWLSYKMFWNLAAEDGFEKNSFEQFLNIDERDDWSQNLNFNAIINPDEISMISPFTV